MKKVNQHGETKLHQAAIKGSLKEVKRLIELGIEIDARDYAGWTALHEACNHDHTKIAEMLLEAGANVNSRSDTMETPLHDAAANHNEELIKILIKFGADPNCRTKKGKSTESYVDLFETVFRSQKNPKTPENTYLTENKAMNMFSSNSGALNSSSSHRNMITPCLDNYLKIPCCDTLAERDRVIRRATF